LVFAEQVITSGLILNEEVYWITFHGIYDFAYLLKLFTNQPLPDDEEAFFKTLELYFPVFFDIRYLVKFTDYNRGSLQKLQNDCNIIRIGSQHQAGSDSIVTCEVFLKFMNEIITKEKTFAEKNVLFQYGAGSEENENPNYMNNINPNVNSHYLKNPDYNLYNTNMINMQTYNNVNYRGGGGNNYYPINYYPFIYNNINFNDSMNYDDKKRIVKGMEDWTFEMCDIIIII